MAKMVSRSTPESAIMSLKSLYEGHDKFKHLTSPSFTGMSLSPQHLHVFQLVLQPLMLAGLELVTEFLGHQYLPSADANVWAMSQRTRSRLSERLR